MAWLAAAGQGAGGAIGKMATGAMGKATMGASDALSSGGFAGLGKLISSDKFRDVMAEKSMEGGNQASANAAAAGQSAAAQGMQFANAGGAAPPPPPAAVPVGTLPQSGYDPMGIMQRLAAFRGR